MQFSPYLHSKPSCMIVMFVNKVPPLGYVLAFFHITSHLYTYIRTLYKWVMVSGALLCSFEHNLDPPATHNVPFEPS
jgi:hypothetical protein